MAERAGREEHLEAASKTWADLSRHLIEDHGQERGYVLYAAEDEGHEGLVQRRRRALQLHADSHADVQP